MEAGQPQELFYAICTTIHYKTSVYIVNGTTNLSKYLRTSVKRVLPCFT